MHKIPGKINIAGIEYSVSYDEKNLKDEDCIGRISHTQQTIRLDETMGKDRLRQVFWHEIIHGVMDNYLPSGEKNQDEKFIDAIAAGVYQVVKQLTDLKK
jgi:hypothetical protein